MKHSNDASQLDSYMTILSSDMMSQNHLKYAIKKLVIPCLIQQKPYQVHLQETKAAL